MAKKRKIFVLDTNVLLHDYNCIHNFQDNDVVIPITVLEELDKFKKGNDEINFHAREFTRELDKLAGDNLFKDGVSLGKGKGRLSIETGKPFSPVIQESFPENTPDHRILAIAEYIHKMNNGKKVVLISKDINLRMKAKSIGIFSQDYEGDKVHNIDDLYKGISIIEKRKKICLFEGVFLNALKFYVQRLVKTQSLWYTSQRYGKKSGSNVR